MEAGIGGEAGGELRRGGFGRGNGAVMERGAEGLFLDQDASCCSCEVVHVGDNTVERGGSFRLVDAAVGPGDLQTVAAGDGEGGGAEQRADAVDRPAGNDRDAAVERVR
ncbi:hypothetical protein BJP26_11225 [Sphingomonas melonis TY]|nr:hypothetical protein BJP26_11225 [Sphingomonas melonis TY]